MADRVVNIRLLAPLGAYETGMARASLIAKGTADTIGDTIDKGSKKAGNALERLGQQGQSFGIPFAGHLSLIGQRFEEADTKGQKFGQTMNVLGGATLLGLGAAFAGVSFEAVRLAASFDKSVASIAGNADISIAKAKAIGNAFLGTAGYMTMSGNEMAAAFAPVAGQLRQTEGSALTAGQSLRFMKVSADLAEGSQTSLGTATAALSQVMQSFHLSVNQASGASDTLFNVSRALDVPVEAVAAAVDKLHGRLGIMMPSLSDVSALMIALGQHGIVGSRGIQVAQTALTTLVGDSKGTQAVLGDLGVKTSDLYGPHGFLGMANMIDVLRPKLAGLTADSQKNALIALFGKSAWEVMGQILGAGTAKFQQSADAANKMGTAHKAAALQAQTLGGEMKILESTLVDLATKFGLVLIPALQAAGHWLADGITWMEKHKAVAEALAAVIGGVLGTAVLVFAEQKAVKFGQGVQSMISDMDKLVNGIETGVQKIIAQFTAQDTAVEGSAATMASKTEASSAAVATEATAVEGSNTAIDASMAGTATAAEGAAAKVGTAAAGEATAVAGADTTIEADNAAAGASFLGMLGPIALVAAAAYALQGPLQSAGNALGKATGGVVGNSTPSPPSGLSGSAQTKWAQQWVAAHKWTGVTVQQILANAQAGGGGANTSPTGNVLSTGTGSALVSPGATSTTAAQLTAYLISQGYNKNAAAGLAGNVFGGEDTAGRSNIVQGGGTSATPVSGVGYGLGQWTDPGRQAALAAYAQAHGLAVGSVAAQEGFMAQEAASIKGQLNAAPNAADAALIAENDYESPQGTVGTGLTPNSNASTSAREQLATQLASGQAFGPTAGAYSGMSPQGGGGSTLPTGTGTIPTPGTTAASTTTSYHYNWQTGSYQQMTAAQYKALQQAWYATNPGKAMPTSPAAAAKAVAGGATVSQSAANSAYTGLSTALAAEGSGFTHLTTANAAVPGQVRGAITSYDTGLRKSGTALLGHEDSAVTGSAYKTLSVDTNAIHKKALDQMVTDLRATHKTGLDQLAGQLETTFKQEETAKDNVIIGLQQTMNASQLAKMTAIAQAASNLEVQAIKDAAQTMTDSFSAAAQAITDATQAAADSANAQSTAIADQAQTTVDQLGERGLYGLNLVAQQQQVAADQAKTGYDAQISAAQAAIDAAQASGDNAGAAQTAIVDAVTAQQNVIVGKAQGNLDTVTAQQNALVQAAQNAVDQGKAGAEAQLKAAQGTATYTEAQAQAQLTAAQDAANTAEAQASSALANANGQASVVVAQAQAALGQAQDQATVAEAQSAAQIAITKQEAQTEYAGSGLTINIEGINPTDASAIASEVGWQLRTAIPV